MTTYTVLVVEDEITLADVLSDNLRHEGYGVTTVSDGESAYRCWRDSPPDLVVLDVMLPGINGVDLCRRLRAQGDQTPVLFLSARSQAQDRVEGLIAGGDLSLIHI